VLVVLVAKGEVKPNPVDVLLAFKVTLPLVSKVIISLSLLGICIV